jgi:mercuric ion transport protein
MQRNDLRAGLVSFGSAFVASLCCLLPLAVVLLGLGSGAFMTVTMQYRSVFLPVGLAGVGLGYLFYLRDKRRCETLGCTFTGRKINVFLLVLASVMLIAELALLLFPEVTAHVLQEAM